MEDFKNEEWQMFLRRMISHNLGLFEQAGGDGERQERLDQLKSWNSAQTGLHNMIQLGNNMKQVEQQGRGKMMFEDEMKALGDDKVVDEFESYFSGLVGDVEKNNSKYSAAMRQLEELLALERETEEVKRKVAGFSLDYDDDLASEQVSLDQLFSNNSTNLLSVLKQIQVRKYEMMERVRALYGKQFDKIDPISGEELQPFLDAVLNKQTNL